MHHDAFRHSTILKEPSKSTVPPAPLFRCSMIRSAPRCSLQLSPDGAVTHLDPKSPRKQPVSECLFHAVLSLDFCGGVVSWRARGLVAHQRLITYRLGNDVSLSPVTALVSAVCSTSSCPILCCTYNLFEPVPLVGGRILTSEESP